MDLKELCKSLNADFGHVEAIIKTGVEKYGLEERTARKGVKVILGACCNVPEICSKCERQELSQPAAVLFLQNVADQIRPGTTNKVYYIG